MMKVVALVLILASTAFAAELNVVVQGPTELGPDETGTINFVLSGDSAATKCLLNGTMLLRIETSSSADLEITDISINPGLANLYFSPDPATISSAEGHLLGFFGPYVPVSEDTVVFSFDVVPMGRSGSITIGLYDHNDETSHPYYPMETQFSHENGFFTGTTTPLTVDIWVPEPASLSLLAIGGLAVLRRR